MKYAYSLDNERYELCGRTKDIEKIFKLLDLENLIFPILQQMI